jgi:hypothetical protein
MPHTKSCQKMGHGDPLVPHLLNKTYTDFLLSRKLLKAVSRGRRPPSGANQLCLSR